MAESQPLIRRSKTSSWRTYLSAEISSDWTDSVLLLGCLATGLLDSAVFNVWSCFVSMQTGNTVYVGLGFTGQPHSQPYRWIKSLCSVLSFILGSFIFSRISSLLGPLRRSTLLLSGGLQLVLTLIPCILLSTRYIPSDAGDRLPADLIVLLPLSLLALQSGGQCVLSRVLGFGEVPTVVLTSAYCDFAMDPKLFSGLSASPKRNRRVGSVFLLVLGAVLGGYLTKDGKIDRALWVVAVVKAVMAGIWLVWPGKGSVRLDE